MKKSSDAFADACREVRSRFPSAFGGFRACDGYERAGDALAWASALPDQRGLHQVVADPGGSSGSLEMLLAVAEEAGRRGLRMVWIDPADALDPVTAFEHPPRHVLWARGGGLRNALRVADAVARDENFPLVCLDGVMVPSVDWRRVPLPSWYRLQRQVLRHGSSFILWSPPVSVPPVDRRWVLRNRWSFRELFDRRPAELRARITVEEAQEAVRPAADRAVG